MNKPYFKTRPGDPPPLRIEVRRTVRFEEVDPLGIVWHGRYPSYFEDARVALGNAFGLGYLDFHRHGVVTPIKKMHLDYHRPLHLEEEFLIEGLLHWSEAARLNFEFVLRDLQGRVTTTGYTVQMMLDLKDNLLLLPPDFYQEVAQRWRSGELA